MKSKIKNNGEYLDMYRWDSFRMEVGISQIEKNILGFKIRSIYRLPTFVSLAQTRK